MSGLNRNELEKVIESQRGEQAGEEDENDDMNTTVAGRALTEVESNCQYTHVDIYEVLKCIRDPEHMDFSLSDLKVVRQERMFVTYHDAKFKYADILIYMKPTVPHCHLTTQIALCLLERLSRYLPPETKWKTKLLIQPGTHNDAAAINKQVNDKERVYAAFENPDLMKEVLKCTNDDVCVTR
eukprot:Rhum_TRINITY_DN1178_c0_g1::Rhum_TRINITY_DN1178_c0_g1_i1::g.3552::m.3552